ncbi:MAG: tyrosine-type recombinase/integrase [Anaerolineaceae bacterium]|nr:tyrosine-type recombinase/integrase [Anaerolineaceae bacterium]
MAEVSHSTISQVISSYLDSVYLARSESTYRTYKNGMHKFQEVLSTQGIDPEKQSIESLTEDAIAWFASELKSYSPATEQCYLTAGTGFYEYLAGEEIKDINLPRVRLLIKQRARRPGIRLPQFPRDQIEEVLDYAVQLNQVALEDERERLIQYRDRAFLLTLADTGLRVHEACGLRRGDIDWHEGRAIVIGKGNREAVVRFSGRSLRALKDYLALRGQSDGAGGKALGSLAVFARHDKAVGSRIEAISTTTGRKIVKDRVREAVGEEAVDAITPHSFRHYFVTTVLQASGNLKLAQELARHKNIAVTQRYSHLSDDELDKKYLDIFG